MAGKRGSDEGDALAETAIATSSGTASSGTDSTMAAPAAAHLAHQETAPPGDLLGEAPQELGAAAAPSQRYVDQGELARGGLGRISRARDRHLGRDVVVKEMLRRGRDEARFVREAFVTASLQHPAIVPVYDAGRWESGEPFFAMRPIEGRDLGAALTAAKTLDARLALLPNLLRASEAVAYAHAHGVIHRDLKPSNILVGAYGDTVVIDWGLAKRIGTRDDDSSDIVAPPSDGAHTVAGAVMGTPAYMPPEQAESSDAVDARADVYALGAILYQLLVGAPPFTGSSSEQILDRVRTEAPRAVLETVPAAPRDLIAIVDKAMARDPGARYANAGELVSELERFTTGRLVAAHEYTRRELVARFVRKNRAAVSVAAIALATLAVAGTIAITQILGARDEARAEGKRALVARDDAEQNRKAADERSAALLLEQARDQAETDPYAALATLARLPPELDDWSQAMLVAANAVGLGLPRSLDIGDIDRFTISGDGKVLAAVLRDGHAVVWSEPMAAPRPLDGTSASPQLLALSNDGTWLYSGDTSGRLVHWNTATGKMRTLRERGAEVYGAWSRADGSVVVYDKGPVVFPADGGPEQRPLGTRDGHSLTFPIWDARHVVESDMSIRGAPTTTGKVEVIDLETASVILTITGVKATRAHWYSASWDERVELVEGQLRVGGKSMPFDGELVSPDGAFAITRRAGGVTAYHIESASTEPVSASPEAQVLGFLGDSHFLAIRDRTTVHVVDLDHHSDHLIELGVALAYPGEHWIAVQNGREGVRIVDRDRGAAGHELYWDAFALLASTRSGRWYALAVGNPRQRIDVYGPAGHAFELAGDLRGLVFSPDETAIAIVGADGAARVRDLASGAERTLALPAGYRGLWVGPKGAWLLAAYGDRSVAWTAADSVIHELGKARILDVSAAGDRVVTTAENGAVTGWSPTWSAIQTLANEPIKPWTDDQLIGTIEQNRYVQGSAVVSPDGARIAVRHPTMRVHDAASGAVLWTADDAHEACEPEMIAGPRLIALCDGTAEVLDLETGHSLRRFEADERAYRAILSTDATLALTLHDTYAQIWDVRTGAWRRVPLSSEVQWYSAIFDGRGVRLVGSDGVVTIPDSVPADPAEFRTWLAGFAAPGDRK